MFCAYCGKQLADTTQFCPECGMKVATRDSQTYNQSNQMQNQNYQQEKNVNQDDQQNSGSNYAKTITKPKNYGILTLVCIASIVLCIPAAAYGFMMRSKVMKCSTQQEADEMTSKTIRAVLIWWAVAFVAGFILF